MNGISRIKPGPRLAASYAAEAQHDCPLPLVENFDRADEQQEHERDDDDDKQAKAWH